jgi:RNA polymerase sigma-70 factor (ECF subfamily)
MGSDEELMQAVQRGDLCSFEQIVLRHQQTAWRVACRFLGDPTEAEDVAQDAFLRILRAASSYRPTAKFQTFLFQVVSRLCLDRTRKKHPVYVEKLPEAVAEGASPGEVLERIEKDQWVRGALDRLPATQRLAVILRYYEELSYQEIAVAMRVSPKAVERLLARARATLSLLLASQESGGPRSRGGFSQVARLI